jgi:serine protease Do
MSRWWTTGALGAALALAAGAGAAFAPVAYGQASVRPARAQVEIFTGGSRIGVSVRDVEESDVKTSKLPAQSGAVVEDVSEDSPAATAGIRKGDVIVEFDGERVRSVRHLTRLVQDTPDGRRVQAALVRDGQRTTVTVQPSDSGHDAFGTLRDFADGVRAFRVPRPARPARPVVPTPRAAPEPPAVWRFDDLLGGRSSRLGITVEELSPQLADYFGTKDGVLVSSVIDDSAAGKAGLKAGDVITAINGRTVDDPADVRRAVQEIGENGEFTLAIVRDRKPQTVQGKVERTERRGRRWTTLM